MASAGAIVLGAGRGTRVGADGNKIYLPLAGRRLVSWALNAFASAPSVSRVVLVIHPDERAHATAVLDREVGCPVELVVGGATRHESEHAALDHLRGAIHDGSIDVIAIHDGARPLLSTRLIEDVVAAARLYGAALPALPLEDVVDLAAAHAADGGDRADGGVAQPSVRPGLVRVQTPQAFRAGVLLEAYDRAARLGFTGTDTSACVERFTELTVRTVPGDQRNIKVTYARDLFLAERILADSAYQLT